MQSILMVLYYLFVITCVIFFVMFVFNVVKYRKGNYITTKYLLIGAIGTLVCTICINILLIIIVLRWI